MLIARALASVTVLLLTAACTVPPDRMVIDPTTFLPVQTAALPTETIDPPVPRRKPQTFILPVVDAVLTSRFGRRGKRQHWGLDFAAKTGTPVLAAADGVIATVRRHGAYGRYVTIRHADGTRTLYAHLSGFAEGLAVGSHLDQGETVGYIGSSGRTTGPNLHFEMFVLGEKVDPAPTLPL
ncbi:M23 family metallopeptidase [Inquilinus sp. CAU 1745]|uniref:M23 family metallopeptidase n=1 Tax=Inquilinus sp. CAU 1745 TaxID=3140369 RepID=UPI00325B2BB6